MSEYILLYVYVEQSLDRMSNLHIHELYYKICNLPFQNIYLHYIDVCAVLQNTCT